MEMNQVATFTNTVVQEVLGETAVVKEDLTNIVDIGNEIFNADTLFLADKSGDYLRAGVSGLQLLFTTEDARTVVDMVRRYQGVGNAAPTGYTRGLYYRDVE